MGMPYTRFQESLVETFLTIMRAMANVASPHLSRLEVYLHGREIPDHGFKIPNHLEEVQERFLTPICHLEDHGGIHEFPFPAETDRFLS